MSFKYKTKMKIKKTNKYALIMNIDQLYPVQGAVSRQTFCFSQSVFQELWILQLWFNARSKCLHNMRITSIPIWRSLLLPHRVCESSVPLWVCCAAVHFSCLNIDCLQLYYRINIIADFKMLIWDLSDCNWMENSGPCRSTDVCFTSAAPLSEYWNVLQMLED